MLWDYKIYGSGMCEGVCNENDSKIPQNLVKFLDPLTPDASQ